MSPSEGPPDLVPGAEPDPTRQAASAALSLSDEQLLSECEVDTFRSGGPGGQHQNVTESGVRLTHRHTGITAVARDERSQHRNRQLALRRLREKLEKHVAVKPKRIATRPSRAARAERLAGKRRRSNEKKLRRRPDLDE
jgi:protein subunit release factor A